MSFRKIESTAQSTEQSTTKKQKRKLNYYRLKTVVFTSRLENKDSLEFLKSASLWTELFVTLKLVSHLALVAFHFENAIGELCSFLEACSQSKRKRIPALFRFCYTF